MTLKELQAEKKRITAAIQTIRDEKKKRIETILAERQSIMGDVSKLSGNKPGKAQLILTDYELIESTYNTAIHELKNQLSKLEADEATANVPGLEDRLEAAQGALAQAAQVLQEREADVKTIESQIKLALDTVQRERQKKNRDKRFESKLDFISKTKNSRLKKQLLENILKF